MRERKKEINRKREEIEPRMRGTKRKKVKKERQREKRDRSYTEANN